MKKPRLRQWVVERTYVVREMVRAETAWEAIEKTKKAKREVGRKAHTRTSARVAESPA